MIVPDWLASLVWLFGCPLAISGLLTAVLIRWAPRLRLVDYPSDRKVHMRPTPRGGGLAVFAAVTLATLIFSFGTWYFLLSATIVLLGLVDDLRPLPWQMRLTVQFAVSFTAVLVCLPAASLLIRSVAVLWIAGLINAFNMLDNMDALSGGVAWIAAGFLAAISWLSPSAALEEWGPFVMLMGALSGFLWFNRPPARIFMGDAGSTFLGFALGLGSVQVILRESGPAWSALVPLCILAVPCYDLLTVVLLRLAQGRSPFHADKQHLSHRLVGRGLSSWTAVRVIYLLALASGASGVLLYAVTSWPAAGLVAGQLAVWWLALAVMEFATKEPAYEPQTQDHAGSDPGSAGAESRQGRVPDGAGPAAPFAARAGDDAAGGSAARSRRGPRPDRQPGRSAGHGPDRTVAGRRRRLGRLALLAAAADRRGRNHRGIPPPPPSPQGGRGAFSLPPWGGGRGWGVSARNWYGGIVQTALLATVAAVFVSAEYAAHYKFPARLIAWEWLGLFAAFFVIRQLAVTPDEQRGLFAVVLAGAVSLAAHGVYQDRVELPNTRREIGGDLEKLRQMLARQGILEGADDSLLQQYFRRLQENNIFGPYAHPNSYAGYLVLWLPGLIGSVVVCRRTGAPNWQTVLAACCALLGGAALWLTHSRGAMLGLVLAGLGVAVLFWRNTLRTHLFVALAALLVLAGLGYGAWRSGLMTTGMGKSSNTVALRLEYWRTTWKMICERPWLGVGPGNFAADYTRLMPATADEKIKDPHNFALEMWATCGVFALIALLVAIGAFFARMVRWLAGSPSPLYSGERGWGEGASRGTPTDPLTPHPSPPSTGERGVREDAPLSMRGVFYLGGMFGLLLAFLLRVFEAPPEAILAETWSAALRSVVWFAAYGLLERVAWSDRGRALALTTGVAALLLNLCVSGGIGFPSVAGPLWVAVALALNARSPEPVRWLSRPGFSMILPLPILGAVVLGYGTYILYPVLSSHSLLREAVENVAYLRDEGAKEAKIQRAPDTSLRKLVIQPLEQALRLTPDDARLHVQLAWWYGKVWEVNLQKTNKSDPRLAAAAIGHGMLATGLDREGSQGYLVQYQLRMLFGLLNDKVAREGPNRDPLFVREGELAAKKQYEEAAKVLESYLPNDPSEAKLRYSLARAYFKAGDAAKGREQAEEALRLHEAAAPTRRLTNPQRDQVRDWLGLASTD